MTCCCHTPEALREILRQQHFKVLIYERQSS